jgi:hypothetical protein
LPQPLRQARVVALEAAQELLQPPGQAQVAALEVAQELPQPLRQARVVALEAAQELLQPPGQAQVALPWAELVVMLLLVEPLPEPVVDRRCCETL